MNESIIKWNYWIFRVGLMLAFYRGIQVSAIQCEVWNSSHPGGTFVSCATMCYALWYNESGVVTVEFKDCLGENSIASHVTERCEGITQVRSGLPNVTMCYCTKNLCNVNLTWIGERNANEKPGKIGTTTIQQLKGNNDHIYAVVGIVCATLVLLVLFMFYMKTRANSKSKPEDVNKGSEIETLIPSKELPAIDLKDVLSQGQFCTVRKGRMGYKDVAVKIFPITQGNKPTPSAMTEKDIYTVCKLNHENILKFIGEHHHEEGSQKQLWLVTEYIEQGSLSDFLKRNTITLENLFRMAQGMALGMAYLHVEIPKVKPSIAHRDMKSKNILVKNNLTCCISDFGLSLMFNDKDGPGDTHGQVGTRRYMAPEVLEGAINFSREAFLRIDMYAFALCLWELLGRCTAVQEEPGDYKLPFEEEVGVHPSLEELQDYVVSKKLRPTFPSEWKNKDQAIDGIIVTIEDCWDHDADARLTADCVAERLKQLCATAKRQMNSPLSVSFKSLELEDIQLA